MKWFSLGFKPGLKKRIRGVFKRKPVALRRVYFAIGRKIVSQIIQDWAVLLMALLTSGLWMLTAAGVGMLVYLGTDALLQLFVGEELVRIGLGSAVASMTLYWGRREFFRVWGQDDAAAPLPPAPPPAPRGRT